MQVKGFKPHPKQKEIINSILNGEEFYHSVVVGRQFGKTLMSINLLMYFGINHNNAKILWVSPVYSQATKVFQQIYQALQPAGLVKSANKADFIIQLINGSTIWFKSAERPETIRGLSINYAFIDEAQDCKDLAWKQSILPTLTAAGKKCIITGTPKRKNWFYDIFMMGKSQNHPNYRAYHGSSVDSPYVSQEFISEQQRTLPPKIFKQEFLAEWQENEGSVFQGLDLVCINENWPSLNNGLRTYGGLDIGNKGDYTVLTIIDEMGRVLYMWRDNKIEYSQIVDKVVEISKHYKVSDLLIETNGPGDPLYEQIKKKYSRTSPLHQTNQTKENIIRRLMGDIQDIAIELPSHNLFPTLAEELEIFEYEVLPSGKIRYTHPQGFHDDCVLSLAIANWNRTNPKRGGSIKISSLR
jgi:hypothetical protein